MSNRPQLCPKSRYREPGPSSDLSSRIRRPTELAATMSEITVREFARTDTSVSPRTGIRNRCRTEIVSRCINRTCDLLADFGAAQLCPVSRVVVFRKTTLERANPFSCRNPFARKGPWQARGAIPAQALVILVQKVRAALYGHVRPQIRNDADSGMFHTPSPADWSGALGSQPA